MTLVRDIPSVRRACSLALLFVGLLAAAGTRAEVTLYTDLTAFEQAVGVTEALVTDAAGVATANEVGSPPGANTGLGTILTFEAANTRLSRSFTFRPLEAGSTFTFDDDETAGNLPNFDNAISVGDLDNAEDDDWSLTLTGGPPMRAFGFVLRDSNGAAGESITLHAADGSLLATVPIDGIPDGNQFLGVVADFDFYEVRFDEDVGGDDTAAADFRFGTDFELLGTPDGLPSATQRRAPSVSGDGRYVAFETSETLTAEEYFSSDVFRRDREAAETALASVNSDGGAANDESQKTSISDDGRFVAFRSLASNLVPDTLLYLYSIYLRDMQSGTTEMVSVDNAGAQAGDDSNWPFVSADGRFVAFASGADNLVAGDSNGVGDIFVRDRQTGQTTRASVAGDGSEADGESRVATISDDGRYVAFDSEADNLTTLVASVTRSVFLHDRQTGATTPVAVDSGGTPADNAFQPLISGNGRYVAFAADAPSLVTGKSTSVTQVYVYDRQTAETSMVSVSANGTPGNAAAIAAYGISTDGRFVAYLSDADNLTADDGDAMTDMFVTDRNSGRTVRVGPVASASFRQETKLLSADGGFVVFFADAADLLAGGSGGVQLYGLDLDPDGDGDLDSIDNCPGLANPSQADLDGDGLGDACDADRDGDGMPDAYENANGLDPSDASDAGEDADGDGLTNAQEFGLGTLAQVADSDGDGLDDGQEVAFGSDPLATDSDGDGLGDGDEVALGRDPAVNEPAVLVGIFEQLLAP